MIKIMVVLQLPDLEDQAKLPSLAMRRVMDSKWQHREEEVVVETILAIAVKEGRWNPLRLDDLVNALKRDRNWNRLFGSRESLMITLANIAATGDIKILQLFRRR